MRERPLHKRMNAIVSHAQELHAELTRLPQDARGISHETIRQCLQRAGIDSHQSVALVINLLEERGTLQRIGAQRYRLVGQRR